MSRGSVAGASLALAALVFLMAPGALAQVDVEVAVLDDSILASFTATGESVESIVVWFAPGDTTVSEYVAEPGWLVANDAESVRVFGGMVADGHTTKIGIKIAGDLPPIYWAAYRDGEEVQGGLLLAPEPVDVDVPPQDDTPPPEGGILDSAQFHTVPDKPAPGSTVRLVGSGFGPHQELTLSIGGRDMGPVNTNAAGGFVATRTIPDTLDGRVDFMLTDQLDSDIRISLRLAETGYVKVDRSVGLSIDSLAATYRQGDRISVSGTATPLDTVVLYMHGPEGDILSSKVAVVSHDGVWSVPQSVILPLDTPLGEYLIVVSDGDQTAEAGWTVVPDKVIMLEPTRSIFEPGETLRFDGTAMPNEIIRFILQNPTGTELILDSWTVGSDGLVSWEFPTTSNSLEGTYTLMASQGNESEFVYAGLGNMAQIPTVISLDKTNYLPSETPRIVVAGPPGDDINILVLDDADTVIHQGNITIQNDGRTIYDLDVGRFSSGVYTAIAQRGTIQDNQRFGVGLSTGASILDISTKTDYAPGDAVRILGTTSGNVLVLVALVDPDGNIVQRVEALVDGTGMLTEQRLRIPLSAESGTWMIRASSGFNTAVAEITVSEQMSDGLMVRVDDSGSQPTIIISGVARASVIVTISEGDRPVGNSQQAYVTDAGVGYLPWSIDVPGVYTITADSGSQTASTTYMYSP